MDATSPARLPDPVDPAAAPKWLARAPGAVVAGGSLLLLIGARRALGGHDAQAFLIAWLVSLVLGAVLLAAHATVRRTRLRRYERRSGFLPRTGRRELPATGRTTLFRLEYGSHRDRVCLMLARWDLTQSGWQRRRVMEHAWVDGDDALALGEQRARLSPLAEHLEDEMDDARLAAEGEREQAELAHDFADDLARRPSWSP
ncbi:MAG: hypothetical protein QOG63_1663 [Thermoleophilaceae bacterium]|nr:hypothetical protein [Thermoleophilaceae bacterium]